MKNRYRWLTAPTLVLMAMTFALAQSPHSPRGDQEDGFPKKTREIEPGLWLLDNGTYLREGPAVPRFFVVRSVFERLHFCMTIRRDGGQVWRRVLDGLGIQERSVGARVLKASIFEAMALDQRTKEPEELYSDFERRQARALGNLFGRLKRQLEELGHDFSALEDYMEKAVRANVTMAAMTPNYDYCDVLNHEFEEGMAEEVKK